MRAILTMRRGILPTTFAKPGLLIGYNEFEGGRGDDTIIGNSTVHYPGGGTAASYIHATSGVTVNLGANGNATGDSLSATTR